MTTNSMAHQQRHGSMSLHFAPMQGYADHHYRRLHAAIYGSADAYYTPFIRVEKGLPRRQDISRLVASADDGTPTVPQIIFRSVEEFDLLTDAVKQLGFRRIDLNLGCPWPMQTRKGRGAAMISNLATMEGVAGRIASDTDTLYSIKTRLGADNPDEWRQLLPVLNTVRLAHVTLHPRTASQMYDGDLDSARFVQFISESANPVVWNGDIRCPADIDRISSRYPQLTGIMIGRGLLGRPSLIAEWRDGEWTDSQRLERLTEFHSRLLEAYESTLCGDTQILQKIKPFWDYLEPQIGRKAAKAIHKATTLSRYRTLLRSLGMRS